MGPRTGPTRRGPRGILKNWNRDPCIPRRSTEPPNAKISAESARRWARLAPEAMARALVLLGTGPAPVAAPGRPSKDSRKAIAEAVRTDATPALAEVDHLLEGSS